MSCSLTGQRTCAHKSSTRSSAKTAWKPPYSSARRARRSSDRPVCTHHDHIVREDCGGSIHCPTGYRHPANSTYAGHYRTRNRPHCLHHDAGGSRYLSQREDRILKQTGKALDIKQLNFDQVADLATDAQEPIRNFLMKHAHLKDRDMFYKLAWRMRQPRDRATLADDNWTVIVPAFVISELKEAFQIGFILFIPFLVVDMVVANILMALGMQMLSPTTISLPFKILLFVLVDGWYLITRGLVMGYS